MRYEVTLNGVVYEVEVDSRSAGVVGTTTAPPPGTPPAVGPPTQAQPTAPAAPASTAPPAITPAPAPPASAAPTPAKLAGAPFPAPMPGLIKQLFVSVGDQVRPGQPLAVLEAMKMDNEIVSPRAATVTEVCVRAGQTVAAGAPLLRLA